MKYNNVDEAIKLIKSGDAVFIHTAAATPKLLVSAMTERSHELKQVKLYSIHTEWEAPYTLPQHMNAFEINAFFVGSNIRKAVNNGHANYIPMFLSEIPKAFRSKHIPLDVALITVSPPDKNGFCTLGLSCDISKAAVDMANIVIAEINHTMPTIWGAGVIHISDIDAYVETDYQVYHTEVAAQTEEEIKIGQFIAPIIEDGSTLQMGIGGIPNAVLSQLKHHKNLGIHTELCSDGIVDLVHCGAINGSQKTIHPGTIISGFASGSLRFYDFLDKNPLVRLLESDFTNNPHIIAKNPKVVAINSAIEIDLFGQVCADSIGSMQYSGVGGQVDFMRGAGLSKGGKPIIAINSRTHKGISKIVTQLKQGASVTTSSAHVHYVATEYGIVNLNSKNLSERAKLLISIAHPDDRDKLNREAYEILKITT